MVERHAPAKFTGRKRLIVTRVWGNNAALRAQNQRGEVLVSCRPANRSAFLLNRHAFHVWYLELFVTRHPILLSSIPYFAQGVAQFRFFADLAPHILRLHPFLCLVFDPPNTGAAYLAITSVKNTKSTICLRDDELIP